MNRRITCPTCGAEVDLDDVEGAVYRPFCSRRCRLVDFGAWAEERYRVSVPLAKPGAEDDDASFDGMGG